MNTPFISVIIPTYNRLSACKRAIESVLLQEYQNFELIVVDDGSSDGTTKASLFPQKIDVPSLFLSLSENCGVSFARNEGIKRASGEWLAFLDSDDIWHTNKLAKQVAWLKNSPNCRIVQSNEIWIRNGVRVNPPKTHTKREGDIFAICLKRCMITPSSVLIRRDLLDEVGLFNEDFPACEDYDLWLRISANESVGLIDEELMTRFGGNEDQLSALIPVQDRYRIRAMINLLESNISLTLEQKGLIYKAIAKKAKVVSNGALKRNKQNDYETYKKIREEYEYRINNG